MADPTPEELQTQIDELKSLITTQYEPPSGSEYSYPVVNQPMNDEMWQYITLAMGDGVLDEGGYPYRLRGRENVNNTLRISVSTVTNTAQAVLRGFYHRLTADKTFTVPGVSSTTTFHFCLTYDPTAANSPGGPITLQMYAGAPPTTMGRFHLVLWKLTRQPNQLLTDAAVEKHRPRVVSTQLVYSASELPDPSRCLWGAMYFIHQTSEIVMAVGATQDAGGPTEWKNLTSPEWTESTSNVHVWAGHGPKPAWRIVGDRVEFRGRVARNDGSTYAVGTSTNAYTLIPNAPHPAIDSRMTVSGDTWDPAPVLMSADKNQAPLFRPTRSTKWISLDGAFYYLR